MNGFGVLRESLRLCVEFVIRKNRKSSFVNRKCIACFHAEVDVAPGTSPCFHAGIEIAASKPASFHAEPAFFEKTCFFKKNYSVPFRLIPGIYGHLRLKNVFDSCEFHSRLPLQLRTAGEAGRIVLNRAISCQIVVKNFVWTLSSTVTSRLIPSPLPSDGRGEGQGEVWVPSRLKTQDSGLRTACQSGLNRAIPGYSGE